MTSNGVDPLTVELLMWVSSRRRTYVEAMDAWRSNCPRHSVWDDAVIDGLVRVARGDGDEGRSRVVLTPAGAALLEHAGRPG